jgi:hypothetical protein
MPRRLLVGIVALAILVLGMFALLHRTSLAFTLGVAPGLVAAELPPGQTVCQMPIDVRASFDSLTLVLGTYGRSGSPLEVTALGRHGEVLGRGRLPGGYPYIARRPLERGIRLDRTVAAPRIALCVRNAGRRRVALYGNGALAARASTAVLDGRDLNTDLAIRFERPPRPLASLTGAMAQRAALFRFPGLTPWIYIALALAVVLTGPWLLLRALRAALTWPADER